MKWKTYLEYQAIIKQNFVRTCGFEILCVFLFYFLKGSFVLLFFACNLHFLDVVILVYLQTLKFEFAVQRTICISQAYLAKNRTRTVII